MGDFIDATLGDVLQLKRGYDLPQQDRIPGKIPIVSSSGITGYHSTPMVEAPGVITGRYGTLGQVFWLTEDFWPLNTTLYVRDFKGNDPRFILYFLKALDFDAYSDKAAVPGLNRNHLHTARVRFPIRIEEQRAISSILGALDDKIDLNRRMNETLETIARAIFNDWFVDFGPTRAKMAGCAPYLSLDIWSLFPDRLDDEGKPAGWTWATLVEFMSFQGGTQPPASNFIGESKSGYVRLLQIRDFDSNAHLTFVPHSNNLRTVSEDDICIGRYGSGSGEQRDSLGRLCRGLSGAINVALVRVVPKFDCREFLATFIGSGDFRKAISGGSARAVQAGFRQEDLNFIKLVRANANLLNQFEQLGVLFWEHRKWRTREIGALAATRDFLLPKLVFGEVRIRDAEKVVEAVL